MIGRFLPKELDSVCFSLMIEEGNATRSKDINRWDLPDTYKFTRNQLQSL